MKNIKKKVDAIREELKEPLPEHNPATKEKKMAVKKKGSKKKGKKVTKKSKRVAKKSAKKGAKKSAKKTADGGVTLAALASEAKISGQKARQQLRAAGIEREAGSRWSWAPKSKPLKAARKALGLK